MGRPGSGGGRGDADGGGAASRRLGRNGPRQGSAGESWETGYDDGWGAGGWSTSRSHHEVSNGRSYYQQNHSSWWEEDSWDTGWEGYNGGNHKSKWDAAEGSRDGRRRADRPVGDGWSDSKRWNDKEAPQGSEKAAGSRQRPPRTAKEKEPGKSDPPGGELDLPIDEHREEILEHIRNHRVTHIQGETGCGKSTRLPQFLLEDAVKYGTGEPRIIVTQPRRMAAVTLARRVAAVLGEELGAGTVGYRISGDVVDGRLCFVTVGYLLQRLVNGPEDFARYTHIILDEVHERGVDADLLSMLVKLLMHCYPSVKLIVMSATLQANLFATYFSSLSPGGRPPEVLHVGARVHPVEQLFLDDIMPKMPDFQEGRAKSLLDSALMAFAGMQKGKGKGKGRDGEKGKKGGKGGDGGEVTKFQRVEPQISDSLVEVCVLLLQQLAKHGCTVIVFLPGIADITSLFEALAPLDDTRENSRFPGSERMTLKPGCPRLRVFALHSMIPRTEQEEVFRPAPQDSCHVVLASNIAESSLTLPSVCAVVDLALRRTVQYDTRRLMCCLVTTWCSQSSCKQRSGRAGRTMPGRAVCLVPRRFFETQMPLFDPPEMLSAPLTKLYLQAKQLCTTLEASQDKVVLPPETHMDVSAPKALLKEVVQPPSMALLEAAMTELAAVGCLTSASEEAEITPLGRVAIALPCDLRLCRLLYFGCLFRVPCDAIAMAAGLTAADPFSAPSLLVLKDQKEYVQKLERSFAARRWCDNGTYSEPLMLRTLFVEWIRVGAPRGLKGLGQFARTWSVMPKKFESLACDAIDLTVRMMKLLAPRNGARSQIEEMLASMHHGVDQHEDLLRTSPWGRPEKVFSGDTDKLRALLALSFSDQMLMHLSPRWVPSGQGKKKKQEEQILELMHKKKMEISRSVALFVPTGQDEESMKTLCAAMCGEVPEALVYEEKSKVAVATFRRDEEQDNLDENTLLWDVPAAVHRLHQFGSGRYRFLVEVPNSEEPTVELFKPLHPCLLQWEVLMHPAQGGKDKKKKPSTVRGMCDWRNPLGFAVHADDASPPPAEFLGCCASVQGLEGGAMAFVAGATVLPLRFLPVMLGTLCPERWSLQFGVDCSSGEVRGLKVLHHELLSLPPKTLAPRVLEATNELRYRIREALTPAWDWEAYDWKPQPQTTKGRRDGDLLDPPDLSEPLKQLVRALPQEPAVLRPKKIKWRHAVDPYANEEAWLEDYLRPLQPLSEEDTHHAAAAPSGGGGGNDREWADLMAYLSEHGECYVGDLPKKIKKPKKQLDKRPDLFRVRVAKEGCYVALAGAARSPQNGKSEKKASEKVRKQQLVDAIKKAISKKGRASLSDLSKNESLKKQLLAVNQKMKTFLAAYSDVFELSDSSHGQPIVTLVNGHGRDGGASPNSSSRAERSRGQRGGNNALLQESISQICSGTPAEPQDFDTRVCNILRDIQERQGRQVFDDCIEMLHEWLSKKARDDVTNWSGYIMKLLTNFRPSPPS